MKRFATIACCALTLGAAAQALGGLRAMTTYTQTTADGKHLLVMIGPDPFQGDGAHMPPEEAAEVRRIRETYSTSGLYRNDGSTEPIWTTDFTWYTDMSSDGRYAVSTDHVYGFGFPHVTFFREGKVLRSYDMDDLVDRGSIWWWNVHGDWPRPKPELNESAMTYRFTTRYGPSYVFDLRTGEIIESHRPAQLVGIILSVTILSVVALVIFCVMRLRRAAPN